MQEGSPFMDEKRSSTRTQMSKNAKIVSQHDINGSDCVVTDITSGGARLHLANVSRLPPTFSLTFDNFRSERVCKVIWRSVNAVGVQFIGR
jgi:hypothetical protein